MGRLVKRAQRGFGALVSRELCFTKAADEDPADEDPADVVTLFRLPQHYKGTS